jgi:uncharacterized protein (TIGR02118 family)
MEVPDGEAHRAVRAPRGPGGFRGVLRQHAHGAGRQNTQLSRYEAARIVATPDGTEPPYYRIFEMYFDDMERLQSSLSTPEGQAAPNDIPNFATGRAKIFICEVNS